jgi:hypothetical protein
MTHVPAVPRPRHDDHCVDRSPRKQLGDPVFDVGFSAKDGERNKCRPRVAPSEAIVSLRCDPNWRSLRTPQRRKDLREEMKSRLNRKARAPRRKDEFDNWFGFDLGEGNSSLSNCGVIT